jgi:rhodanese-related sulfurtransferase
MPHETLDPKAAKERLDQGGWIYLDVRSVEEFDEGHVPDSYNIPLLFRDPAAGMVPNPEFVAAVKRHFAADAKLVLGCKSGGRSQRACELLSGEGYKKLVNMDGGMHGKVDALGRPIPGWIACGFPAPAKSEAARTWKVLRAAIGR